LFGQPEHSVKLLAVLIVNEASGSFGIRMSKFEGNLIRSLIIKSLMELQ